MGKEAVAKELDACVSPLKEIKDLILQNPDADDEKICTLYNSTEKPTLEVYVVSSVREMLENNLAFN